MTNCESCRRLLNFKKATICTKSGSPVELSGCCKNFLKKEHKLNKKRGRIEKL